MVSDTLFKGRRKGLTGGLGVAAAVFLAAMVFVGPGMGVYLGLGLALLLGAALVSLPVSAKETGLVFVSNEKSRKHLLTGSTTLFGTGCDRQGRTQ